MATVPAYRPGPRSRPWLGPLSVGAAALGACGALTLSHRALDLVPDCPFRAVTGLDCPLCGGTRAVRALAGGDVVAAAGHNLVVVALLPLLAYAYLRWAGAGVGVSVPRLALPPWFPRVVVAVVVVFAVARNLPVPALSWLASG